MLLLALQILTAAPIAAVGEAEALDGPEAVLERTTVVMGTLLRVRVEGAAAEERIEGIFAEMRRLERVLSSWSEAAELGAANAAPAGASWALSPELAGLLAEAGEWVETTEGAFDPAVGALIDAWDLRGEGRSPTVAELDAARAATGWNRGVFDPGGRTLARPSAGWWLDSGGFGKGAALRNAARMMEETGVAGTLDFGGQLMQVNARGDDPLVAVAHPQDRARPVALLRVENGSVATSAASENFVVAGVDTLSHIVDPRSGVPVRGWGSVTVVAADPFAADAVSTALFVMGAERALAWAQARTDVGVLVLETRPDGLHARWNRAMEHWLVSVPEEGRLPADSHALPALRGN